MTAARIRFVARLGGRRRSSRSWFVVGSALFHVVLFFLLVLLPGIGRSAKPRTGTIPVTLAAAPAPARPAAAKPVTPPPPAVEPEPEPEPSDQPRVADEIPEPQPDPPPKPKPEPKPKKAPQEPAPVSKPAAGPTPPADPAPGAATGGEGSGVAVAAVGLDDPELAWYRDRVAAALHAHWRRPMLESVRESLAVTVSFEILPDGSVRNPRIAESSGVPSLDRSALRAAIEADPLPPLPSTFGTTEARYVFRWYP